MEQIDPRCGNCAVKYGSKLCQKAEGSAPEFCPTAKRTDSVARAVQAYSDPKVREFARQASIQEASCYADRDAVPHVLRPMKTRLQETVEFAKRMGYKRLGLAFCVGVAREAMTFQRILEAQGFDVVSVVCKVGRVPKETIGITEEQKVYIGGGPEAMCNPIAQAALLNEAGVDFAILMGLCVGHDSLFLKYVEAPATVFAVKDRVLGHNPMAAIYTAESYYQKLSRCPVDVEADTP